MTDRITIQDIADALGISRNTVSKAINNTGILADATREKVLKKAAEMGYKQFSYFTAADLDKRELFVPDSSKKGEIVLLTTVFWGKTYFISSIIDVFQKELSRLGYSLVMHRIQDHEIDNLKLPDSLDPKKIAGIICFEMFHHSYCQMICGLDLPVLFVDAPAGCVDSPLKADRLFPDNQSDICAFVAEMVRRNKKRSVLWENTSTASLSLSGMRDTGPPCSFPAFR